MRHIELRPTRLVLGLTAGVLIALAPAAFAGDGTDSGALDRATRLVERLDTDGDGKLSAAELAAGRGTARGDDRPHRDRGARGARRGRRGDLGRRLPDEVRARLDTNSDGTIDRDEVRAAAIARHREHATQLDADHDGTVTPDELRTAREAKRAAIRARIDTDGNGTIDEAERAAAREAFRAAVKARLDTNGDGTIDEAEAGAAREGVRRRHLRRFGRRMFRRGAASGGR